MYSTTNYNATIALEQYVLYYCCTTIPLYHYASELARTGRINRWFTVPRVVQCGRMDFDLGQFCSDPGLRNCLRGSDAAAEPDLLFAFDLARIFGPERPGAILGPSQNAPAATFDDFRQARRRRSGRRQRFRGFYCLHRKGLIPICRAFFLSKIDSRNF